MTVLPPPVVAVGPVSSAWDPGPRRPRLWPASLLALLLVLGGAAYGGWGYYDLVGVRYLVREDLCRDLDLSAAEAALGALSLRPPRDRPTAAVSSTPQADCGYEIGGAGAGLPGGLLEVRAVWHEVAPLAAVRFAQDAATLDDDVAANPIVREVPGLGQEAVAAHEPDGRIPVFIVLARDHNLTLTVEVALVDPVDGWARGAPDEAFDVLTEVLRTTFDRVS